jgi:hypothetical protein
MTTIPAPETRFGTFRARTFDQGELPAWLSANPQLLRDPYELTWRPSPALAANLPSDLAITFHVLRGPDGLRRVLPLDFQALFDNGWLAGLEILRLSQSMSGEQVFSYRVMRFLFQRIRAGREHLGRKFDAARDLYVREKGRGGRIRESLLPEYVGRAADGGGHVWSIHELTQQGRRAARQDGIARPNNRQAIVYGLTLAAELNPLLNPSFEDIRRLVFAALLDPEATATPVSDAEIEDVSSRLCVAFEEHQRDTGSQFQAWLAGPKNNLVQTLARKSGYAVFDRRIVKAALVRLGVQSYDYMAQCLGMFAQAVRQGFSEPLNEAERRRFDALYLPKPEFGGLPLLLLWERKDLLRNVLIRLWSEPDDERLIGTLHRLLAIYGDLTPMRREADRQFKELPPEARGSAAASCGGEAVAEGIAPENPELRAAVESLVEARRLGCSKCRNAGQGKITLDWSGDSRVHVEMACERYDFRGSCDFEFDELRDELQRLSADSSAVDAVE